MDARRTKATSSGLKNNGNLSLNICFDKIAIANSSLCRRFWESIVFLIYMY